MQRKGGLPRPDGTADLFRGSFVLCEIDLVVPTAALPVVFARYYRSDAPELGPLGFGWDHNHEVFVRELDDGGILRRNGQHHEDVFRRSGGAYEPPDSVFETLEAIPGRPHTYEITAAEGLVQRFERPAGWTDDTRIPLAEIRDRHDNRILYTYDADSRLIEARDDDGRFLRFGYGARGLLASVEDQAGRRVVFTYNPDTLHLCAATRAATRGNSGKIRRIYHYANIDAAPGLRHAIVAVKDGEGRTLVTNAYDEAPGESGPPRLVGQAAGGHAWRYVHTLLQWTPPDDPSFNVPSAQVEVLEPGGGVTIHTFNRCGDLLDRRFRLSRDGSGRVVAWTYGFDRRRNLIRIVQPDGGQEVRTYDDASPDPRMRGRLLCRVVRPRSGFLATDRVVWRGTYEPRYQLLASEFDESGGETRYRYDFDIAPGPAATGKLVEIEHPTARLPHGALQPAVTRFEANARGQITAMVTPRGSRHEIEYGVVGAERGLPVLRRYDVADLAIEEKCGYDSCGFLRVVTDGTGATRLVERDAEGLIERRVAPAIDGRTAPPGWSCVTRHDSNGLPIAVERPRGDLVNGEITGASIEDHFERDALGNVVRAEYGANTASPRVVEQRVRWDGLPIRITAPSGTMIQLEYDERGLPLLERTVRAGGPAEQTRRAFDVGGRLEQRTRSGAGAGQDTTARCSYDAFGRIHRIDRSDGTILRYTWGARDLLLREEAYVSTGDDTVRVLVRRRYEYDERGRLVRAFEASARADGSEPDAALEHQFYFDEDDDLVWIVDPRGGEQTFEHDGLGRVIRYIDSRGNSQQTGYDAAGRLTSLSFQSLEPDGDIAVRALRFEHDARGRWIRVTEPDGAELCTTYDDQDLPVHPFEPGVIKRHRRFGPAGELITPALPDPDDLLDAEGDLAILAMLAAEVPVNDRSAARWGRLAEGAQEELSLGEILTGAGGLPAPQIVLPDPAVAPTPYGIIATGGSAARRQPLSDRL